MIYLTIDNSAFRFQPKLILPPIVVGILEMLVDDFRERHVKKSFRKERIVKVRGCVVHFIPWMNASGSAITTHAMRRADYRARPSAASPQYLAKAKRTTGFYNARYL
jgi:hypothetical protein